MLDIIKMNVGFIIYSHYTGSQVRLTHKKSFIKEIKRSAKKTNTSHPTDGGQALLDPSSNQCDS